MWQGGTSGWLGEGGAPARGHPISILALYLLRPPARPLRRRRGCQRRRSTQGVALLPGCGPAQRQRECIQCTPPARRVTDRRATRETRSRVGEGGTRTGLRREAWAEAKTTPTACPLRGRRIQIASSLDSSPASQGFCQSPATLAHLLRQLKFVRAEPSPARCIYAHVGPACFSQSFSPAFPASSPTSPLPPPPPTTNSYPLGARAVDP